MVTVSQKGVVLARSQGTAIITAKAQDGSGKKAKCTITVKKVIRIKNVKVMSDGVLKIELTDASKLTAKNFAIKSKKLVNGAYLNDLKVSDVYTDDYITYYVVTENGVGYGEYIHVYINSLTGSSKTATYEMLYSRNENKTNYYFRYVYLKENENIQDGNYDDYVIEPYSCNGYTQATWSELPKGIKAENTVDRVILSGRPTESGLKETVFTFKDELGYIYKTTVVFMTCSEEYIVAPSRNMHYVTRENNMAYVGDEIIVSSNNEFRKLKYEIIGNNYGLAIGEDDEYMHIYGDLAAGTYDVKIKITDTVKNISATVTYRYNIQKGIKITGNVKDLAGAPIPDIPVYADNNEDSKYGLCYSAWTDEKGNYTLYVSKGNYDIQLGVGYLYSRAVYEKNIVFDVANLNFKANIYTVTIKENSDDTYYYDEWYDEDGKWYGDGSILYLKPGTYKLTSKRDNDIFKIKAILNINVNSNLIVTPEVKKEIIEDVTELKVGTDAEHTDNGSCCYYSFKAEESGYYKFYSKNVDDEESYNDPWAYLYGDDGVHLRYNDDTPEGTDYHFSMINYCEAGKTYYLKVYAYDECKVCVSESNEEEYNSYYNSEEDDDYDDGYDE